MNPLADLVTQRSGSPISEVLQEAPKLVDPVSADPVDTGFQLTDLFKTHSEKPETDDDDYIPLTAEEIKTKAESKAQMYGALIALFFGFVQRYGAYQKLREGDKLLIKQFESEFKLSGNVPVYNPDHPYYAARDRWNDFEEALDDADEEASLNEAQLLLLRRAIEADLKAKNKRGTLKTGSISETLFEIVVIKAMSPLMQYSMMAVNKMVDKSMR